MGNIYNQKLTMMSSFPIYGGKFYAPPLSDILNKQNIKEIASNRGILVHFNIP